MSKKDRTEQKWIGFTPRQWSYIESEAQRLQTSGTDVVRRIVDQHIDAAQRGMATTTYRCMNVGILPSGGEAFIQGLGIQPAANADPDRKEPESGE